MEMMYTLIANALQEMGMEKDHHPTDYLNFFCLGNREVKPENVSVPSTPADENSPLV